MDPFRGLWPELALDNKDSFLWGILKNDILVSALVYFRHNTVAPSYSLSHLLSEGTETNSTSGSYTNYSKNLGKYMPCLLLQLFGISKTSKNGAYSIKSVYPHLLSAIISSAQSSVFSQNKKTRTSMKYNLGFANACFDTIFTSHVSLASHPAEEIYVFERLWAVWLKLLLPTDIHPSSTKAISLSRYMPNATTRISFLQGLLSMSNQGFDNDDHDEIYDMPCDVLKLIGGYIFPVWQWLFCTHLERQYSGNAADIIRAIESVHFYNSTLKNSPLLKLRVHTRTKYPISRSISEMYTKRFADWDIDWWMDDHQVMSALAGKPVGIDSALGDSLLFQSPLYDPEFLSFCLP